MIKKEIMKHYITKALLCLSMALLIFNCQKEDITEHTLQTKVEPKLKIVKLTNNEITANKGITQKLDFFAKTLKTKQQNKTVYSSEHDFYINTDFATYIEKPNGSHSYTFAVQYAEETGEINNLVLHSKADGSYDAIYLSYDVTTNEKALINQGLSVNLEGKVSYAIINDATFIDTLFSKVTTYEECLVADYSVGPCNAGYTYEHGPEPFAGYSGGMCSGSTQTLVSVGYDMDCINDVDNNTTTSGPNNAGNPNGNPNNSTTNNGTPGGSANSGSDTPPITTPVTCEGCPPVEEDCQEDEQVIADLENIFGVGNVIMVDCNSTNGLGFTSLEDLEDLKDSLFGEKEGIFVEDEDPNSQNERIARFAFNDYLTEISIVVKQQLGTDYQYFTDYSVLNVTSTATMTSFMPISTDLELIYSQQDYAVSMESYESTVEVHSNSILIFTFFGEKFKTGGNQKFILKMNATDGSKISGVMNPE